MNAQILSLSVFIIAYLFFIIFPHKRSQVALGSALALILTQTVSLREAFFFINWNVMGIFLGTLIIADVFMESRAPAYFAEIIVNKAKNTAWAILFICLLTGFISAFVENVATVLIVAPIAIAMAKRLKFSPVNVMIAIAVSSNLQGAATLIGDPPSMLLAGFAKMNFGEFFFYKGRPGIFFAVELGALVSFWVLYLVFRQHRENIKIIPTEKITSWFPTILLISLIGALAISSFLDKGFSYLAGAICMIFGFIAIIWKKFIQKKVILEGLRSLDWDTTLFLVGIFVLVGSVASTGWIEEISTILSGLIGGNIFLGYTLLVVSAVIFSAFVDNIPFLAAMLPVAMSMAAKLQISPALFLFGLLIGASLGGNITPIGASANIVACGLLKKEGHNVRFGDFMKIGIPFTLAAVGAAYLFIWLVWHP